MTVVIRPNRAEGGAQSNLGQNAHAEGGFTQSTANASHSEGNATVASGGSAHAEGSNTTASGSYSHAEGNTTVASAQGAHAEGIGTTASANYTHAGGYSSVASAVVEWAHGANPGLFSAAASQMSFLHVGGNYSASSTNTLLIGGGTGGQVFATPGQNVLLLPAKSCMLIEYSVVFRNTTSAVNYGGAMTGGIVAGRNNSGTAWVVQATTNGTPQSANYSIAPTIYADTVNAANCRLLIGADTGNNFLNLRFTNAYAAGNTIVFGTLRVQQLVTSN